FSKEGIQGRQNTTGQEGGAGVKQPAVVPQQNFLVPTELPAAPRLRSGRKRRSLFPGFWYLAGGTSAWPWRQADKAYTGSEVSVKHQTHDQSACASLSPCYELWAFAVVLICPRR